VKVTDAPKVELAGPLTVVVLARFTTRVVVAVWVMLVEQSLPLPPVPVARTTIVLVPVATAPVVFTVNRLN
jgi:hypothetical protein